ncbi:MAG: O-antigen ligase family protein [Patescibacteria group bacterium]|jgi:O-antigen ligase
MIGTRIGKIFWLTLACLIVVDGLSLWGWHEPNLARIFVIVLAIVVFGLSYWRLDVGMWIVLAELIVGSKGYILSWAAPNFVVSIRLVLFAAIILAWLITRIRQKNFPFIHSSIFRSYVGLLICIFVGVIVSLLYHNKYIDIFYDVNGYLYLGLLPVMYDAFSSRMAISKTLQVIWAALMAIFIKTAIMLFIFAGQFEFMVQAYRWIRDTRIDEVTLIAGNAYRIFSQSQIWSMFGFLIALIVITLSGKAMISRRWWWFFMVASGGVVIISYSRSFWLALIITLISWLWYLFRYGGRSKKAIVKYTAWLVLILAGELLSIILIIRLPNLLKLNHNTASLSSLVEDRLANDQQAGLQSRWNLIKPLTSKIIKQPIVGHGFGSTITYQSKDPRITAGSGGGAYTTYSFEWGYLDILLKIGVVGLVVYAWFVGRILKSGYRAIKDTGTEKPIMLGLFFAMISLLITHITTPYLNHPLGLGLIMFCAVVFEYATHDDGAPV